MKILIGIFFTKNLKFDLENVEKMLQKMSIWNQNSFFFIFKKQCPEIDRILIFLSFCMIFMIFMYILKKNKKTTKNIDVNCLLNMYKKFIFQFNKEK